MKAILQSRNERTEQRDWPSIEEQKQYWKNKEKGGYVETVTEIVTPYGKVVDEISTGDATNETRVDYTMHGRRVIYANRTQAQRRAAILGDQWQVYQSPLSRRFYVAREEKPQIHTDNNATTADSNPNKARHETSEICECNDCETEALSRTEATCDWYDHGDEETPYRLRDEGRNPDGSGESYAERNL